MTGYRVRAPRGDDAATNEAIALGDEHKRLLGLMPEGAFREEANLGHLLVAEDMTGAVAGYLLYRVARNRAVIAHLCVREADRGRGVARLLLGDLRPRCGSLPFIEARCRRDYAAHAAWERLGFHAEGSLPGRGHDGAEITRFVLPLDSGDLFAGDRADRDRLTVVLDTCVLIALQDRPKGTDPEIDSIRGDWISQLVEFCVVDEIYNDINHADDSEVRDRRRGFAAGFRQLSAPSHAVENANARLDGVLALGPDRQHLAQCIAVGNVSAFLTIDAGVLARRSEIVDAADGLRVLRPSELVVELDSLCRAAEYSPIRVAGTLLRSRRVTAEWEQLATRFRTSSIDESSAELATRLRGSASEIRHVEVRVVEEHEEPIGLYVLRRVPPEGTVEVPIVRVHAPARHTTATTRALARYLACHLTWEAIASGARFTIVSDRGLHPFVGDGLRAEGFLDSPRGFVRAHENGAHPRDRLYLVLRSRLADAGFTEIPTCARMETSAAPGSQERAEGDVALEDLLHPAKCSDGAYQRLLLPIRPQWAEHLFDTELASRGLFGADPVLRLSPEHVYYRSRRGPRLVAPGRMLWYVSRSRGSDGLGSVRACSRLREVHLGRPDELHERFRRLGVYARSDVRDIVRGDLNERIMALCFDRTEVFSRAVSLPEIRTILRSRTSIPGPIVLDAASFVEIYTRGMRSPS